jgi:hypothetical protein
MSTKSLLTASALLASVFIGNPVQASIVVQNTNFITTPTHFNGFEALSGYSYSANSVHSEGGINVSYVGAATLFTGDLLEGQRSWYPNGGGDGYTKISLADGSDFQNVQFLASSGFLGAYSINYRLMNDGLEVATGNIARTDASAHFFGFSGFGFDEVDLQATRYLQPFSPDAYEGLILDNISVEQHDVPEPASVALFGLGLIGALAGRRKLRSTKNA